MPASLSLSHFAVLARDRNGFGYFGRANTILLERERIKRQTIANRRLQHQLHAA